jgi:hypothetical protein
MDRDPEEPLATKHPPGHRDRQAVAAQMGAGLVKGECDIEAVIDQELASARPHELIDLLGKCQHVLAMEIALAQLNRKLPSIQRLPQNGYQRPAFRALSIRDENET